MNEIINNKNFFAKTLSFLREKYKFFLILTIILIIIYGILQLYLVNQKNKILTTSINYNNTFFNKLDSNFQEDINKLSLEKNFFGTLALLEKIKIYLSKGDFYNANKNVAKERIFRSKETRNIKQVIDRAMLDYENDIGTSDIKALFFSSCFLF